MNSTSNKKHKFSQVDFCLQFICVSHFCQVVIMIFIVLQPFFLFFLSFVLCLYAHGSVWFPPQDLMSSTWLLHRYFLICFIILSKRISKVASTIVNVSSLVWMSLLQISIGTNTWYQTANLNAKRNFYSCENSSFVLFLILIQNSDLIILAILTEIYMVWYFQTCQSAWFLIQHF